MTVTGRDFTGISLRVWPWRNMTKHVEAHHCLNQLLLPGRGTFIPSILSIPFRKCHHPDHAQAFRIAPTIVGGWGEGYATPPMNALVMPGGD